MSRIGKTIRRRVQRTYRGTRDAINSAGELLDAAINAVAPGIGARREASRRMKDRVRHAADMMVRHDAARNDRLRGSKWLGSRLSPDSVLEQDLADVRTRAQELYQNFGYCRGAIESRVNNVVGTGIRPQSRIRAVPGLISEDDARLYNEQLDTLYRRIERYVGRGGRQSMTDIQKQTVRNWKRDGDGLVIFSDVGRESKPIPLELRVVDAERLDTPPKLIGDRNTRLGIRKDDDGVPVEYWLQNTHPFDTKQTDLNFSDFAADRVAHIYDELWPDQSRGLPWFAAVLNDVQDFKDYREAVIIAAQVAACVTMVVSTADPDAVAKSQSGELDLEPGKILFQNNVDDVHTLNPSQPTTTYASFAEQNLLGIAGGIDWPYGWLVKDRRRATFSSGRLEEIDGSVPIRSDQKMLEDKLLNPFWRRMVQEAMIIGESTGVTIPIDLYRDQPWLFDEHVWIGPGRKYIDPIKEVTAAVMAKEHNIDTLTDIHAQRGHDTEDVLRRRGVERQLEADADCVPPVKNGVVVNVSTADEPEPEGVAA